MNHGDRINHTYTRIITATVLRFLRDIHVYRTKDIDVSPIAFIEFQSICTVQSSLRKEQIA